MGKRRSECGDGWMVQWDIMGRIVLFCILGVYMYRYCSSPFVREYIVQFDFAIRPCDLILQFDFADLNSLMSCGTTGSPASIVDHGAVCAYIPIPVSRLYPHYY